MQETKMIKETELSTLVLNLMKDRLKIKFKVSHLVMEIRELRQKKSILQGEILNLNNEVDRLIKEVEGY